jgi:hypothetical protein
MMKSQSLARRKTSAYRGEFAFAHRERLLTLTSDAMRPMGTCFATITKIPQ